MPKDYDSVTLVGLPNGVDAQNRPRLCIYLRPDPRHGPLLETSPFRHWARSVCPNGGSATLQFRVWAKRPNDTGWVYWDPQPLEVRLRTELWDHVFAGVTHVNPEQGTHTQAGGMEPEVRALSSAPIEDFILYTRTLGSKAAAERLRSRPGEDRLLALADRNEVFATTRAASFDPYVAPGEMAAVNPEVATERAEVRRALWERAGSDPRLARDLARLDEQGRRPLSADTLVRLAKLHAPSPGEPAAPQDPDALREAAMTAALKMQVYYQRPSAPEGKNRPASPDPEDDPTEFHNVLVHLGDTPALYTHLGLAFDVVLPEQAPFPCGLLRVEMRDATTLGDVRVESRPTAFVFRDLGEQRDPEGGPSRRLRAFTAASRNAVLGAARTRQVGEEFLPQIDCGLLRLDPQGYRLVSLDVDGTVMQDIPVGASAFRAAITSQGGAEVRDTQLREQRAGDSLPALRTAGLSLVYGARAKEIKASMAVQKALVTLRSDEASAELYAEDLVDGYRVDIWDNKTGEWCSACARTGRYHFLAAGGGRVPFRAPLTDVERAREEGFVSSAAKEAEDHPALLEMRDDLFTWNGWNLAVASPDGAPLPDPVAHPMLRILTEYEAVPRSLTPLRFGVGYRFRCRAVDPCGNSLSVREADAITQMREADFTIGHREVDFTNGDRANGVREADEPQVFRRFEPVPAPIAVLYEPLDPRARPGEQIDRVVVRAPGARTLRWIVPSRAAQNMVEMHGMLSAGRLPGGAFAGFRLNEDGSFPTARQLEAGAPANEAPESPDESNAVLLLHPSAPRPKRAYYPDPQAWRARIEFSDAAGRPIDGAGPVTFAFYEGSAWPDARPLLLELVGGTLAMDSSARVRWTERELSGGRRFRVLQVTVRPWETVHLSVSSAFGRSDRFHGQQVQAFHAGGDDERDGKNPVLTPEARIALVHATRRPPEPATEPFVADRTRVGTTRVRLTARTRVAAPRPVTLWKSTSRVDWVAEWKERLDDPARERPEDIDRRGHVASIRVVGRDEDAVLSTDHDLGDTKHRVVLYRASTVSAFAEYFTDADQADAFSTKGPQHRVVLPSTARPTPPEVSHILPSFRWDEERSDRPRTSDRRGAVRIYLKRPWFSSGIGEMLGVVTLTAPPEARWLDHVAQRLGLGDGGQAGALVDSVVSRWGRDPIWSGPDVPPYPSAVHFRDAQRVQAGLGLAELGRADAPMTVVAYEPSYDPESRLWFCDVELNPGPAYNPFVQLALVRYQPSSLPGVELSTVVPAGFAQLPAGRSVTLVRQGDTRSQVITVRGPGYHGSAQSREPTVMEVHLELGIRGSDWVSWRPETDPQTGQPLVWRGRGQPQSDGSIEWTIRITVSRNVDLKDRRLILREYETHFADPDRQAAEPPRPARRLVFATVLRP